MNKTILQTDADRDRAIEVLIGQAGSFNDLHRALQAELMKRNVIISLDTVPYGCHVQARKNTHGTYKKLGSIKEAIVYAFELLDQQKADSDE